MKLEIFKGLSKNRSSENRINQAQQKVGIKIHRSVVTLLNHVIIERPRSHSSPYQKRFDETKPKNAAANPKRMLSKVYRRTTPY